MPRSQHDKTRRAVTNTEHLIITRVEQLEQRLEASLGGIAAELARVHEALPEPEPVAGIDFDIVASITVSEPDSIRRGLEYVAGENEEREEAAVNPMAVIIVYDHPERGPEARVVEPRAVNIRRAAHLHAFDTVRNAPRNFSLDRIQSVTYEAVIG